jgi:hypothetical protein
MLMSCSFIGIVRHSKFRSLACLKAIRPLPRCSIRFLGEFPRLTFSSWLSFTHRIHVCYIW